MHLQPLQLCCIKLVVLKLFAALPRIKLEHLSTTSPTPNLKNNHIQTSHMHVGALTLTVHQYFTA